MGEPGPVPPAGSAGSAGVAELVAELVAAGRRLVRHGLVIGSGGNLSARMPGGSSCLVTAAGSWLDELTGEDLSEVALSDGAVLAGNPAPSSEVALHLASYRVRPDVRAVVHVHPQHAVLLSAL
ncbi:MAG TPA: class II aldolase/adducin family protein, partial [Mycobacteriales bacterium]|nr:class II aldolase/adducin family protein [Mycobacteriales bacterium]